MHCKLINKTPKKFGASNIIKLYKKPRTLYLQEIKLFKYSNA